MDTKSIGIAGGMRSYVDPTKSTKVGEADARVDQVAKKKSKDVSLSLSDEARELALARDKAVRIAQETNDIRQDRVDELKAKIKDGSYKVDAQKVADGMLLEAMRDEVALGSDTMSLFDI